VSEVWPYVASVLLLIGLLFAFAVGMHFLRKMLRKREEQNPSSDERRNL